ncbi:GNAT family N-acetyltransferase [Lacticaseibacillus mingshuiensis]|uniref:GNAT family N-acetyltransferase n=1 Tax=Lacticaseibacillus mingshuiensis TaxID=2799574 RepID=UPI00194DD0A8|nr:GNAT family N-acetyltransferase [Lacticaseibacillus mingshuiensis]
MKMRPVRPGDAAILTELREKTLAALTLAPEVQDFIAHTEPVDERVLARDLVGRVLMVAKRPVAFYRVTAQDSATAVLDELFVDPAFQNQGIGQLLFTDAVRQARLAGKTELSLLALPTAEGFYRKMGMFPDRGFSPMAQPELQLLVYAMRL